MARTTYLTLDKKGRATLPEEVREALGVGPGDFVRLEPTPRGTFELVPAELVPRHDLWQLDPEARARLADSRADLEAGRVRRLGSAEEAKAALDALKPPRARAPKSGPSRPRRRSRSEAS